MLRYEVYDIIGHERALYVPHSVCVCVSQGWEDMRGV